MLVIRIVPVLVPVLVPMVVQVVVRAHALALILERRIVEVPPAALLALVLARRRTDCGFEVVGRVAAEDADRQLVRIADEVRPRSAAAARGKDKPEPPSPNGNTAAAAEAAKAGQV